MIGQIRLRGSPAFPLWAFSAGAAVAVVVAPVSLAALAVVAVADPVSAGAEDVVAVAAVAVGGAAEVEGAGEVALTAGAVTAVVDVFALVVVSGAAFNAGAAGAAPFVSRPVVAAVSTRFRDGASTVFFGAAGFASARAVALFALWVVVAVARFSA